MSVLGCCSRPNGVLQRAVNFTKAQLVLCVNQANDLRVQAVEYVYRQYVGMQEVVANAAQDAQDLRDRVRDHAAHVAQNFGNAVDNRFTKLNEQRILGEKSIKILRISALALGCLGISFGLFALAEIMAKTAVLEQTLFVVAAIASSVFSHDFMKIAHNIKLYISSPLLAANIAVNPDFSFWDGSFIFSKTLILEKQTFLNLKNLIEHRA